MKFKIFEDLVVIEMASVLAGPSVGMFFAELGARVIKVENLKTGGDVTRSWKLPQEASDSNYSAYYHSVNWGKECHMLDLSDTEAREYLLSLVESADIVISNFKSGSAEKLGVDYPTLKQVNPLLIYAQLVGYDLGDPTPAFDVILQAEAGFMYMTGSPEGAPVKMPVALIDLLAAHQLKEAVLIALLKREKENKGCFISTSLAKSAIASLANQASNWLNAGFIPQRIGSRHPNIAPYGDIFTTKDGQMILLAVGTDEQFRQLCWAIELPHLIEDDRFKQNSSRVQYRNALIDELQLTIQKIDRMDLIERLTQRQVPFGRIRNMQEVFELPWAADMILKTILPNGKEIKTVKSIAFEGSCF